jgi:PPP family 3-phenylpropionic acid transporter
LIDAVASLQSWARVFAPYTWGWLGDHRGRRVGLFRLACAGALAVDLGLLGVREAVPAALVTALLFLAPWPGFRLAAALGVRLNWRVEARLCRSVDHALHAKA